MPMQSPPAHVRSLSLSLCSHVSQSSCQALIAWAVVDYSADAMRNAGVVASGRPGVALKVWSYANFCLPAQAVLFPQSFLLTCCRIKLRCEDIYIKTFS